MPAQPGGPQANCRGHGCVIEVAVAITKDEAAAKARSFWPEAPRLSSPIGYSCVVLLRQQRPFGWRC